ncbi:unnamed protein product, partial [Mesorhabditis belari]|uniref:Uncharacterized protein n=1 Tax=Mesorhabditis belari TaxID=2138241 RepID=A0AAF3EQN9_9BILA
MNADLTARISANMVVLQTCGSILAHKLILSIRGDRSARLFPKLRQSGHSVVCRFAPNEGVEWFGVLLLV